MPDFNIRDYLYAALLILLVSGFTWYTIHERDVGQEKVVAADARAVAAAKKLSDSETALTQARLDLAGKSYEKVVTSTVVGSPHVVCISPSRPELPPVGGDRPEPAAAAVGAGANTFDPGPQLDTIGRNADAQISGLIDTVKELQSLLEKP